MCKPEVSTRTFRALAIAAACAFAAPASAATIGLLDVNLPAEVRVTGTNFEVDEQAGLARLAVDLYDESFEGNISTELVVVPGLTFDRELREVRYEGGGSVVTCARRKKILWGTSYPATEACRTVVRSEPRNVDAGFGARPLTRWVVELVTDEPARSTGDAR